MSGPILLQGAMDVETELLISTLESRAALTIGGWPFWTGRIGPHDAVVSLTHAGTINAAAATALGIQRFRPAVVINQGVAGSHREDLHVGDIVVASGSVPIHNLDMLPRGRGEGTAPFAWKLKGMASASSRGPAVAFPADPDWTARLMAAPYAGGQKVLGLLGSGDVFNREADRILWLRERLGEACEEMESIGTFRVCATWGVPCAGVRILSNNELTGEPYTRETGETLQRFLLELLRTGE